MGAVRMKAFADLRRRRLQTFVIASVLALACSAATVALDTLVESQAPFDQAFAAANGAHLVIDYSAETTPAELAHTATAAPVTASAGPWPVGPADVEVPVAVEKGGGTATIGGGMFAGRSDPEGPVDRITVSAGRWWQRPGEIVVSQSLAQISQVGVGSTIVLRTAPVDSGKSRVAAPGSASGGGPSSPPSDAGGSAPVRRSFTVVGIAASISTPGVFGWLSPTDLAALAPSATLEEMLYRVAPAATDADIAAGVRAITGGLPPTAVASTESYLSRRVDVDRTARIFVPILLAFSLFALLAAAFVIANLVSGIVLVGYREIGVMKAVGFTPPQVTSVLLAQVLVPASVGAAVGVAIGTAASQPIMSDTARAFGLPPSFAVSPPVIVAVLLAAGGTAVLAAIGPALRAGRLSVVGAITRGTTPSARADGGRLRRAALGLPVPTPARIGLAAGVAHPVQAAMTLGALTVGVVALVFSVGMNGSLVRIAGQLERDQASPIRIELPSAGGGPAVATVDAAIAAEPGTARSVAIAAADVSVPQLGGPVPFVGYRGDAAWTGYALISGRWFSGPGEAVAPTNFFTTSGLHVGDAVTVADAGRTLTVTLVGEIFDQARENRDDLVLRGQFSDLASLVPGIQPTMWEVQPRAGVDPETYRSDLGDAIGQVAQIDIVQDSRTDKGFLIFEGVISALGVVLVLVSIGGVFDTVLLETRRRVRETAVLKTIGMTPRQVVGMVLASIVPVGIAAGLLGVPLGIAFQRGVLVLMGQAASGTGIPESSYDVIPLVALAAMGLAGVAIGAIGAWLPARRAARAPIAVVLQAE
jgi:putative ABC transport system permease protein